MLRGDETGMSVAGSGYRCLLGCDRVVLRTCSRFPLLQFQGEFYASGVGILLIIRTPGSKQQKAECREEKLANRAVIALLLPGGTFEWQILALIFYTGRILREE